MKWDNYYRKHIFATQNEPPTAKLSISGVRKHFSRNWQKNNIKGLKIDFQKEAKNSPENNFF